MEISLHNKEIEKIIEDFYSEDKLENLIKVFNVKGYSAEFIVKEINMDRYTEKVTWVVELELFKQNKKFHVFMNGRAKPVEENGRWVDTKMFITEEYDFKWVRTPKVPKA